MACLYLLDILFPNFIVPFFLFIISHHLALSRYISQYPHVWDVKPFPLDNKQLFNYIPHTPPPKPCLFHSHGSGEYCKSCLLLFLLPTFLFKPLQSGFCPDHSSKFLPILANGLFFFAQLGGHFLDSYWPPSWNLTSAITPSPVNYSTDIQLKYKFLQDDFLDPSMCGEVLP